MKGGDAINYIEARCLPISRSRFSSTILAVVKMHPRLASLQAASTILSILASLRPLISISTCVGEALRGGVSHGC